MARGSSFLGDARARLLPASIPFRFFGAAVFFHLLAWLTLFGAGAQAPSFAGGTGLTLGALHLLTLGVLVSTAMGASLQLLPVATRQAVASPGVLAALWWSTTFGVALLVVAMVFGLVGTLAVAAGWLVLALLGYAVLLGRNLWRARGMPLVVVHGWAALACLLGLLGSGLSLAAGYHGHGVFERSLALGLHVTLAAYGFMGLLVLGFSHILLPMFVLAPPPPMRLSWASVALVVVALALATGAALGVLPALVWRVAIVAGLAGLICHVAVMSGVLRSGMRRQLGRSMLLMQLGWTALALSLVMALALKADVEIERLRTLFVVLLLGGLLSFLLGVLSRIVPFLAAMHAPAGKRGPPLPSKLTHDKALALHFALHLLAFALLLAAVVVDSGWLVRAAAALGSGGAVAFGWFFVHAWRQMRQPHGR